MKKITKRLCLFLAVCMILSLGATAFAAKTDTSKDNKAYSMSEIQDLLLNYFDKNNINLELGTEEFYEYTVSQLIYGSDMTLAKQPHYDLIAAYLTEYKINYEEASFESPSNDSANDASSNLTIQGIAETETPFYEDNDFLNTTIGNIIDQNKMKETKTTSINLYSTLSASASTSSTLSSYSASAAVSYARKWAGSYDDNNLIYNPVYFYYGTYKDCTNFVSQCLYAGGIPMVGCVAPVGNLPTGAAVSTTNWYAVQTWLGSTPIQHTTTSWIGTVDFKTFLTSKAKSTATKYSISSLISSCAAGDVVQLTNKTTGSPTHTIIITSRTSTSATYCGHSYARTDESVSVIDMTQNNLLLFDLT